MLDLRAAPEGVLLRVRVHPGARRNAVGGVHDGAVKVSLTTPPVDGRANEALVVFLAERLHIAKGLVRLMQGATSRSKTVLIVGLTALEVEERLLQDVV